jgi:DNA-binding LytR/AlgR family response regulator
MVIFGIVWIAQPTVPTPSPLLAPTFENRLSKYQTANLYAISSQDHYLNVQTDEGSELILMRLSDALVELSHRDGVQIHRSHWVARAGVAKHNAASVTLHNNNTLPISRSNAAAAKAFFAQRLP